MLILLLAAVTVVAVFLLGVLVIAIGVTMRHGDPSATFKLYAVRDGLIDAVVFRGVPRDNPWLEVLYENVNRILFHSNLTSGPGRWLFAVAVGLAQASHQDRCSALLPLPADADCPAPIRALGPDLREALEHLARNHIGLILQVGARERRRRQNQQMKARHLLRMMRENDSYASATP
jgi:hypothetical protein